MGAPGHDVRAGPNGEGDLTVVGPPAGLYYALGLVMLIVAAYGLVLLVTLTVEHRAVGRDVEMSHVVMGVAMAGMFVPAWSFGPSVLWEFVFAAFLVWFLVRSFQSVQAWGLHIPHTAVHAVMSFAMLLMYWFPMGSTTHAMSMTAPEGGARIDPGLSFVLAFVLFGSAIFTIASPNKGATHFGTHGRGRALLSVSSTGTGVRHADVLQPHGDAGVLVTAAGRLASAIATPSLMDASHVVMSVGMGLMLVLMI